MNQCYSSVEIDYLNRYYHYKSDSMPAVRHNNMSMHGKNVIPINRFVRYHDVACTVI